MRKIILSFVFFIFSFIVFQDVTEAETAYSIQVPSDTSIFETIGNERVKVGTLLRGETIEVLKEDSYYYYFQFGNGLGYISKNSSLVKKAGSLESQDLILKQTVSNNVVITTRRTVVFDSLLKSKKAVAIINRNIRMPILSSEGSWYKIRINNQEGYIPKSNTKEDTGIPVLMYHHMLKTNENRLFLHNNMVISVESFQEQMDYLHKQGFRTITLQELEKYMNHELNLTGKVVAITFDDGITSSERYAYPILKKYHFKATQFLIGDRTRNRDMGFDPDYLQYIGFSSMKRINDVFDFQSHTYNLHLRDANTFLPFMIFYPYEFIKEDLLKNQQRIGEQHKGAAAVKYLAYPFGQYDEKALQAAKDTGITMAFTTKTGYVQLGDSMLELNRQGVGPYHTINHFIKKVEGTY